MKGISLGRWAVAGMFIGLAVISFVSGATFLASNAGTTSTHQLQQQSNHTSCVTTIETARRSVFDNVDIYKAIQIEQLSTALLAGQQGIKPTAEQVEAFAANDALLQQSLAEARRLQPAKTLDNLIDHGGTIAGVHYPACPG